MITIGTAACNEFSNVLLTLTSLYHQARTELNVPFEILCIDNTPSGDPENILDGAWNGLFRVVRYDEKQGTAAAKQKFVDEARYDLLFFVDSHVIMSPGSLSEAVKFFSEHTHDRDIVHGIFMHTKGYHMASSMKDEMSLFNRGVWYLDRPAVKAGVPFEINMSGTGHFVARKKYWPGFHPAFEGFSPEEF